MKYILDTPQTYYYPLENRLNKSLQVLDLILSKPDSDKSSDEQFIEKIKSQISKHLHKQITIFANYENRGATPTNDTIFSMYLAYDPKDFAAPAAIAQQLSQILPRIPENLQEILGEVNYKEQEVLEKLAMEQTNDSSFDGSDGDTEDSQKSLKDENKALRNENEELKKRLALLEGKQGNNNKENLQIIMDQKHIMDQFQKECNFLAEEKFILTQQNQKYGKEIQHLGNQVNELMSQVKRYEVDTRHMEENFNKNIDDKQKQINKFVTFFLIQENKGKCFSNDRSKQRTWEVQEMLKEHHMRKYLKESLSLN